MTYTVKYKLPGQWLWRTVKRVKGDGLLKNGQARYFVLEDEARIEVPVAASFVFAKERFYVIKKLMEAESGHPIVTKE